MANLVTRYREIPQDYKAEGAVIGSMIIDPSCIAALTEFLSAEDFVDHNARFLFALIIDRWKRKEPIDAILLAGDFHGSFGEPRFEYMVAAMQTVPSVATAIHYARRIYDKSIERKLILLVQQAGESITDDSLTTEQKIQSLLILRDTIPAFPHSRPDIGQMIADYIARLKEGRIRYISTGFNELDYLIDGFGPGDLVLIAGCSSIGKSSLLTDFFINTARTGHKPYFLSLEMCEAAMCERLIKNIARCGTIDPCDPDVMETQNLIEKWPAYFEDRPRRRIDLIQLQLTAEKAKSDIGICFVDYVQKIDGKGRDPVSQISDVSGKLAALAMDLQIPIIAACQLNRSPMSRDEHRPRLCDLRGSGSLEQDAEVVIFIHRDDYFTTEKDGKAELIVAKNRHGPTGTINLIWLPEYFSFAAISPLNLEQSTAGGIITAPRDRSELLAPESGLYEPIQTTPQPDEPVGYDVNPDYDENYMPPQDDLPF